MTMSETHSPEIDPAAFEAGPPERPLWPAMRRGWRRRCPSCGRGPLLLGYLTLRGECPVCAEDLSHARADDGPAYLSILITAKLIGSLMVPFYVAFEPDPYTLIAVFSVGVSAMALYLLPRLKGLIVGVQWAKRMHGF